MKNEIKPILQLWETIEQFDAKIDNWRSQPLTRISVEEIEEHCADWHRKLLFCRKNPLLKKFKGPMLYCNYIMRQTEHLKKFLPLLTLLKGRGM